MNKKGTLYMGALFAVLFLMLGFLMLPLMKDGVTDARTNLDCTNTSISHGNMAMCLSTDIGIPYFIIALLTFVGGFIGREM